MAKSGGAAGGGKCMPHSGSPGKAAKPKPNGVGGKGNLVKAKPGRAGK